MSMKIITILGSPRKRGNTATVLSEFEKLIATKHQVERINITDYAVRGCLGCKACYKRPDEPGCVQKDDAVSIIEKIMASDVVVYSTPLYMWSFSAQMKALMDRHYCMVKWKSGAVVNALLDGKRAALLVTCEDGIEDNAELIQVTFDREMDYLRCSVIGKYIVPNCTTPSQLGDKAIIAAQEMFNDIAKREELSGGQAS